MRLERTGEGLGGKLRSLVRVERLGCSVTDNGFLCRFDAERGIERVREPMGKHLAAMPVDLRDPLLLLQYDVWLRDTFSGAQNHLANPGHSTINTAVLILLPASARTGMIAARLFPSPHIQWLS